MGYGLGMDMCPEAQVTEKKCNLGSENAHTMKNPVVNGVQLFVVIYSFKDQINAMYSVPKKCMHVHKHMEFFTYSFSGSSQIYSTEIKQGSYWAGKSG